MSRKSRLRSNFSDHEPFSLIVNLSVAKAQQSPARAPPEVLTAMYVRDSPSPEGGAECVLVGAPPTTKEDWGRGEIRA